MKISIFGTGYVGLVTGVCFAEHGHCVTCADINPEKIKLLNQAVSPIYEPGLEPLIEKNKNSNRLHFTTDLKKAVQDSDLLFIAVGTPSDQDGSADLKYVLEVAEFIAKNMTSYKIIVTKSTVPVGTNKKIADVINYHLLKENKQISFDICSNPEFLREGSAIQDCLKPVRVVIGVESNKPVQTLKDLYSTFIEAESQIIFMDVNSAELTKYAANTMLANRISFMNELSQICEKVGANIEHIRKGIGTDFRIGTHFLNAGIGYGGSCFPKDVRALSRTGKDLDLDLKMLSAIADANTDQKKKFFQRILKRFDGQLKGRQIGIWGLSFKPGTDDLREAPSLDLIWDLTLAGAQVTVYDPVANEKFLEMYQQYYSPSQVELIHIRKNSYEVLNQSDALCIVTEWPEFKNADLNKVKLTLKSPIIFDGRNVFSLEQMKAYPIEYHSVGRPSILPNI